MPEKKNQIPGSLKAFKHVQQQQDKVLEQWIKSLASGTSINWYSMTEKITFSSEAMFLIAFDSPVGTVKWR